MQHWPGSWSFLFTSSGLVGRNEQSCSSSILWRSPPFAPQRLSFLIGGKERPRKDDKVYTLNLILTLSTFSLYTAVVHERILECPFLTLRIPKWLLLLCDVRCIFTHFLRELRRVRQFKSNYPRSKCPAFGPRQAVLICVGISLVASTGCRISHFTNVCFEVQGFIRSSFSAKVSTSASKTARASITYTHQAAPARGRLGGVMFRVSYLYRVEETSPEKWCAEIVSMFFFSTFALLPFGWQAFCMVLLVDFKF